MDQNFTPYSTPFSLYLKSKSNIYSVTRINTLPTIATAISVVAAITAGIIADRYRNWWLPSVAVSIPVLIGVILLVFYDVGESGRLAGFIITGFEGGMFFSLHGGLRRVTNTEIAISPLTMSWATVIMAGDAEERAIVTASMNAIGQAMAAWTQILQYPATHAPRFRAGFISNMITTIAQFISVGLIAYLQKRDARKRSQIASGVA